VSADDLTWVPPGPGQWYASPEHMPEPVTTLFAELFPQVAVGWASGAERYGLPPNHGIFGDSNRWFFYSPGMPGPVAVEAMEQAAAESLTTERWRHDLRRWRDEVRPQVLAENRALLAEDLGELDDAALADHVDRAVAHYLERAPQHFAEMAGLSVAQGALFEATAVWGLDQRALLEALAGAAEATASAEVLFDRIAVGLRAAGAHQADDLDSVREVGADAAAALDELLQDYAWRAFHSDLARATLAERPAAIIQGIRAALGGRSVRFRPDPRVLADLGDSVPESERARFDDLVDVARVAYGANDDNSTVLYSVPLGLVRRAVLELGQRLVDRRRLHDTEDALEATQSELQALLSDRGPSAGVLAARAAERHRAADFAPPPAIGTPLPPSEPLELPPSTRRLRAMVDAFQSVAWGAASEPGRATATVGTVVVEGRALVADDPIDALLRMEPGDVLVALTTTAPYNSIFPLAAAVAVEHGGLMSHATVLARELGITAVIGLPGLLARVHDGDRVRVDPTAGTISVLDRAT